MRITQQILETPQKYFEVGYKEAETVKGLTKVPLFYKGGWETVEVIDLAQAKDEGKIKFCEVQKYDGNNLQYDQKLRGKGWFRTLVVKNNADVPLVLYNGQLLIGKGKESQQDRMVEIDVLVPEKTDMVIPVYCNEMDRSHARSASQDMHYISALKLSGETESYGGAEYLMAPMGVRACAFAGVVERGVGGGNRQDQIWKEIRRTKKEADVKGDTETVADLYVEEKSKEKKEAMKIYEGEIGAIFLSDDVMGMEFLDTEERWKKYSEGFIKSYLISAKKEAKNKEIEKKVDEYFKRLKSAKADEIDTIGIGSLERIKGQKLTGVCISLKEVPLHFSAAPASKGNNEEEESVRRIFSPRMAFDGINFRGGPMEGLGVDEVSDERIRTFEGGRGVYHL